MPNKHFQYYQQLFSDIQSLLPAFPAEADFNLADLPGAETLKTSPKEIQDYLISEGYTEAKGNNILLTAAGRELKNEGGWIAFINELEHLAEQEAIRLTEQKNRSDI